MLLHLHHLADNRLRPKRPRTTITLSSGYQIWGLGKMWVKNLPCRLIIHTLTNEKAAGLAPAVFSWQGSRYPAITLGNWIYLFAQMGKLAGVIGCLH